jgi:hypothetical protein
MDAGPSNITAALPDPVHPQSVGRQVQTTLSDASDVQTGSMANLKQSEGDTDDDEIHQHREGDDEEMDIAVDEYLTGKVQTPITYKLNESPAQSDDEREVDSLVFAAPNQGTGHPTSAGQEPTLRQKSRHLLRQANLLRTARVRIGVPKYLYVASFGICLR